MKFFKCLTLFVALSFKLVAQETIAIGVSGIYNIPVQSIGFGVRVDVPVAKNLSVVPRMKYMPGFNSIHELGLGANLHYNLISNISKKGGATKIDLSKPVVYVSVGALYNNWINYIQSVNENALENNILPEIGLGFRTGGNRFRGFVEGKLYTFGTSIDVKGMESYVEAGILFYPFNPKPKKILKCQ